MSNIRICDNCRAEIIKGELPQLLHGYEVIHRGEIWGKSGTSFTNFTNLNHFCKTECLLEFYQRDKNEPTA